MFGSQDRVPNQRMTDVLHPPSQIDSGGGDSGKHPGAWYLTNKVQNTRFNPYGRSNALKPTCISNLRTDMTCLLEIYRAANPSSRSGANLSTIDSLISETPIPILSHEDEIGHDPWFQGEAGVEDRAPSSGTGAKREAAPEVCAPEHRGLLGPRLVNTTAPEECTAAYRGLASARKVRSPRAQHRRSGDKENTHI